MFPCFLNKCVGDVCPDLVAGDESLVLARLVIPPTFLLTSGSLGGLGPKHKTRVKCQLTARRVKFKAFYKSQLQNLSDWLLTW